MTDLFLQIVNMSISASWLVIAVFLLRFVLKKAPKWTTVLLWGIVGVRLLCPFSIESAMSLIPSTETINPEIMMDSAPVIQSSMDTVNDTVTPKSSQFFTPISVENASPLDIWFAIFASIWAIGMVVLVLYSFVSYLQLRRKVKTAVRLHSNVFQSENVNTPFVLGIIKPKIYLPFKMDNENIRCVLAHEQAHIRRRDYLWKPLGFILLTIHWFNPIMWLAYILLCRDIELACDEKVIKELSSEQRADYSQALLACSINRAMIAACPLAFGEVGVKTRVKSVLNYKKPAFWTILVAIIACIVVAVCFLTNPIKRGGTDTPTEDVITSTSENSDEQNSIIWNSADLDHDGENENIYVREKVEYELYELVVEKQDGTMLWSTEAGIPHVGWNTILLYQSGGKDYLVQYKPTMYQGIGNYTSTQFSLEGGKQTEINSWSVEFNSQDDMSSKMREFEQNINTLLENSTVLISTEQGELVVGPKVAAELQQIYPVRFE